METKEFIQNYREAFGSKAPLPLLFGYSDKPIADTEKIGGCFFRGLQAAREGQPVSLSVDVIGCGGGKLYTGFSDMPERVPGFVSLKEKKKGDRCFIGLFDPSVRPWVGKNELSFTIPYSRFVQMTETMKECFLFDSHAWAKVKARLEE